MASKDDRYNSRSAPIAKKQFDAIAIANADGTDTITTSMANIDMLVTRMDVITNAWTSAATLTITIADENGVDIFGGSTFATIAKSTNTMYLSTKSTADFAKVPVNNTLTVSATLSEASSTVGASVQVILYGP